MARESLHGIQGSRICFSGIVLSPPELLFTKSGTPWCSVILSGYPKGAYRPGLDNPHYITIPVDFFGDRGLVVAKWIRKSDEVLVIGRLGPPTRFDKLKGQNIRLRAYYILWLNTDPDAIRKPREVTLTDAQ